MVGTRDRGSEEREKRETWRQKQTGGEGNRDREGEIDEIKVNYNSAVL